MNAKTLAERLRPVGTPYNAQRFLIRCKSSKPTPPTLSELLGRLFGRFCSAFQ
jgi:hypothetical protein